MRSKSKGWCALVASASLVSDAGAFWTLQPFRSSVHSCGSNAMAKKVIRGRSGDPRSVSNSRLNGVPEWKAAQPGESRELGFLPFPVDDIMCPGETKALHLYEARFLALFEEAIRNKGGCVGGAIFVEEGVLVKVGHLCDIIAWEREEVGISVAVRCVGRVEISDVTSVDPYIRASVREIQDTVGDDHHQDDKDTNAVVSSDVFSLHRQCVDLERKMAASGVGEGRISGLGDGSGRSLPSRKRRARRSRSGSDGDDPDKLFGAAKGGADGAVGKRDPEADDLMARFQRGGGELDMSEVASATEGADWEAGEEGSAQGSFDVDTLEGALVSDMEESDEDDDDQDEEGGKGQNNKEDGGERKRSLEDLLWGHETRSSGEGFDQSLEGQVEAMHDLLKADLGVSLDEGREGLDASRFGAALRNDRGETSSSSWGEAKTIAELIVASGGKLSQLGGGGVDNEAETSSLLSSSEDGDSDGENLLWGCSSREEEHDQLVSYVSLGCFDPTSRLQSLMIMSTGQRLRMARDALAERLKVLVAKSALSQLGD